INSVFKEEGIEPAAEVQINLYDYQQLNPHGGAMRMLSHYPDISAVICVTDNLALPVYQVAEQMELSVPEDISVVSLDDQPVSRFLSPPLTTVRQPLEDIGRRLAKLAESYAEGKYLGCFSMVPPRLIVRKSIKNL
ncbi:MAG: LacI family DNA-binding transcriptional regulator, partial [Planctomycetes bacterium]|nr:LacI family DNA-binding transcriptional regulator [Planctomycetota bacterium]